MTSRDFAWLTNAAEPTAHLSTHLGAISELYPYFNSHLYCTRELPAQAQHLEHFPELDRSRKRVGSQYDRVDVLGIEQVQVDHDCATCSGKAIGGTPPCY